MNMCVPLLLRSLIRLSIFDHNSHSRDYLHMDVCSTAVEASSLWH